SAVERGIQSGWTARAHAVRSLGCRERQAAGGFRWKLDHIDQPGRATCGDPVGRQYRKALGCVDRRGGRRPRRAHRRGERCRVQSGWTAGADRIKRRDRAHLAGLHRDADLVDEAKQVSPRCLERSQRLEAFLDPEPPAWCIETGKWPYHTQDWKDWLV